MSEPASSAPPKRKRLKAWPVFKYGLVKAPLLVISIMTVLFLSMQFEEYRYGDAFDAFEGPGTHVYLVLGWLAIESGREYPLIVWLLGILHFARMLFNAGRFYQLQSSRSD